MFNPKIPDDAGELVEAYFAEDVEILAGLAGMVDDSELDGEHFTDRVMGFIALEDQFEQD